MSLSHDEAQRLRAIELALTQDDPVLTHALRRHQLPKKDRWAPFALAGALLCFAGVVALLSVSVLASFSCAVGAAGLAALADHRSRGRWRMKLGRRVATLRSRSGARSRA